MPRRLAALATVASLAACAPPARSDLGWTRANTSSAAYEMDATACRVEAAQRIPPAYAPMAPAAPQTTINVLTPRQGPQFATQPYDPAFAPPVDRNAAVRGDAFRLCMFQRGYTLVQR